MKHSAWWLLFGLFISVYAHSAELPAMSDAEKERIRGIVKEAIREYAASLGDKHQTNGGAKEALRAIVRSNRAFMRKPGPAQLGQSTSGEHPRATVVACSDSRMHTHALDASPGGDLYIVRNLGNQIAAAEGSVEYGVNHLHTPLLLIVGHVACATIKAVAEGTGNLSPMIQRELDAIQIPKGDAGLNSVKLNINNQVRLAMSKFEQEVIGGHLTVVGAVYDSTNEMRQGQGKLNIVNVNGETNAAKIAKLDLMQGLDAPIAKTVLRRPPVTRKSAPVKAEEETDSPEKPADKPVKHKEGH
jgi:carbonic anhydrase